MSRVLLACGALAIGLAIAGCAQAPSAGPPVAAPPPAASAPDRGAALQAWQAQRRAAALEAERQGRHADAVDQWEAVVASQGAAAAASDVERWHAAQARALQESAARERAAAAAYKRGDLDDAERQALRALAAEPTSVASAQVLRAIEHDRALRQLAARRGRETAAVAPMNRPRAPAGSNATEHASLLAEQGELGAAIATLEETLRSGGNDDAAVRRTLAELYVRRALALAPGSREAAVRDLRRALAYDPRHAQALALLREWTGSATSAPRR